MEEFSVKVEPSSHSQQAPVDDDLFHDMTPVFQKPKKVSENFTHMLITICTRRFWWVINITVSFLVLNLTIFTGRLVKLGGRGGGKMGRAFGVQSTLSHLFTFHTSFHLFFNSSDLIVLFPFAKPSPMLQSCFSWFQPPWNPFPALSSWNYSIYSLPLPYFTPALPALST